MSVWARLREERQRLALTQTKLGEIAGVSKRTVINWEKGATSPTVAQLLAIVAIGLDCLFVLTDVRQASSQSLMGSCHGTSTLTRGDCLLIETALCDHIRVCREMSESLCMPNVRASLVTTAAALDQVLGKVRAALAERSPQS